MQQAVETDAELEARRAQLKNLMTRVVHEHKVSIAHVHEMVETAARAVACDISEGDAPMDAPPGDWQDDQPPPRPSPRPAACSGGPGRRESSRSPCS